MYEGFSISVIGHSHKEENIVRQDAVLGHSGADGGWSMAVVSDGHGGVDYFRSHIGARLAVESAAQTINEYMKDKELFLQALQSEPEKVLWRLRAGIIDSWNKCVERFDEEVKKYIEAGKSDSVAVDFGWGVLTIQSSAPVGDDTPVQNGINLEWEQAWIAKHKVKIKEDRPGRLYGCTLLACVMASEFCVCLQVGDGCSVEVRPNGAASLIFPEEKDDAANYTDSLCDADVMENFRAAYILPPDWETVLCGAENEGVGLEAEPEGEDMQEPPAVVAPPAQPAGIILSSDGLFNSFNGSQDFFNFNRRVLSHMEPSIKETFGKELEAHLSERSRLGSDDDISIAMAFDSGMDFEAIMLK